MSEQIDTMSEKIEPTSFHWDWHVA